MIKRVQIGLSNNLTSQLDEIGFANKIKTRPKIIQFLVNAFLEARK